MEKYFYETLNFSNNQRTTTAIDISDSPGKRKEDPGGIRALSHDCTTCSTLPGIIVYGRKKEKRVLMINGGVFAHDNLADDVYVPMFDLGDGGGGGNAGEDGSNGTNGDGTELESIQLSNFNDWAILNSIWLVTDESYPGQESSLPWRWWETLTHDERAAIEQVRQEFLEDEPSSPCSGTVRWGGNPFYNGTAEHIIIQVQDMSELSPGLALREYAIPFSSAAGNTGYADLVNTATKEIFEIKPANNPQEIFNGRQEVQRYVDKACLHCGGTWVKGNNYTEKVLPYPGRPGKNMRVRLAENGLITYQEVSATEVPLPVAVPQAVSQKLRDFIRSLLLSPDMVEEQIAMWLRQNPEVKNYVIAAGVGLIITTILQDLATFGVGVVDDIPTIMLAMRLIRLARAIP